MTLNVKIPAIIKSGPVSAHQQNAISMAFRWWADSGPLQKKVFSGVPTSILLCASIA